MAKQKKDQEEDKDNLNEDNLDDINEADDSFGLPDVEYQPLESDESQGSTSEAGSVDDTYEYSSDSSDSFNEGPGVETQEAGYIPGSYSPPKDDSNKTGIVVGIIIVLLMAAAAIWFFGFHRPAQLAEQARIEKQRQAAAEKRKREAELQAERERIAREQAELEVAEREAEEAIESETGTIEAISARTGRYYVVIASAIDGDLAMDYAKELSTSGQSVKIIEPYGNVKFYRVTVQDLDTWNDAQNRANEFKAQYGDGVWVIKY